MFEGEEAGNYLLHHRKHSCLRGAADMGALSGLTKPHDGIEVGGLFTDGPNP